MQCDLIAFYPQENFLHNWSHSSQTCHWFIKWNVCNILYYLLSFQHFHSIFIRSSFFLEKLSLLIHKKHTDRHGGPEWCPPGPPKWLPLFSVLLGSRNRSQSLSILGRESVSDIMNPTGWPRRPEISSLFTSADVKGMKVCIKGTLGCCVTCSLLSPQSWAGLAGKRPGVLAKLRQGFGPWWEVVFYFLY